MIYTLLFMSSNHGHNITPDCSGTRFRMGLIDRRGQFGSSLPLLRTCQHVHEEATSILYGKNIFYFDDQQHGTLTFKTPQCNQELPWCDLAIMYAFFAMIGKRNVRKIRHLRLDLSSLTFLRYPDEPGWSWVRAYHGKGSGANCVGVAIDLLCKHHNLATVEITNSGFRLGSLTAIELAESSYRESRLVQKLRNMRGVKELKSRTIDSLDVDQEYVRKTKYGWVMEFMVLIARMRFDKLKAQMEAPDPAKVEGDVQRKTTFTGPIDSRFSHAIIALLSQEADVIDAIWGVLRPMVWRETVLIKA